LACCVAVHGGVHGSMGMDGLDPYAAVHAIGHLLGQMISLASIVFNGVLERFPKIKFGFLEGGVAWLLFCLELSIAHTRPTSCAISAAPTSSCVPAKK
jgi:hypothetical protein